MNTQHTYYHTHTHTHTHTHYKIACIHYKQINSYAHGTALTCASVYSSYDVRNCRTKRPGQFTIDDLVRQLEVLPGLGFDDLRNVDMEQVFSTTILCVNSQKMGNF